MKSVIFTCLLALCVASPALGTDSLEKLLPTTPVDGQGPIADARGTGKTVYTGNVKTLKYHKPDCKFYNCRDCTRYFSSPAEARKAGYTKCKVCWK